MTKKISKKSIISKANVSLLSCLMLVGCSANINVSAKSNSSSSNENVTRIDFEELLKNVTIGFDENFNDSVLVSNAVSNANILNQEVSVIIELEDNSTVDEFLLRPEANFASYYDSRENVVLENNLVENQVGIAKVLLKEGLVKEITGNYTVLLNGISATTTYSNVEKIRSIAGVKETYIGATYAKPMVVHNDTNTDTTGIYNNDTQYDGSNTIVAVLDSGFDYSHEVFQMEIERPAKSKTDIANVLENTRAYQMANGDLDINDVYLSSKVPFAYDYADKDIDVYPIESDHGTHVSGIIGGQSSVIKGIAPQTQFAWLKVFNDETGGGKTEDIVEALEDAVLLGVDAINMSLGSLCGYSAEVNFEGEIYETERKVNTVYSKIEEVGISLLTAAGNEYSSGYQSTNGTNLASNPESGSISAPGSYSASLAVASINGILDPYALANDSEDSVFFVNSYDSRSVEHKFDEELFAKLKALNYPKNQDGSYDLEYVTVPGYGLKINYTGIDVKGKIALVKRGNITFEEKLKYAYQAGAIAILIYNNVTGTLTMTVGENVFIPVALITNDSGKKLAEKTTGKLKFNESYKAGPFMSDFSSWGPLADLTLKPEITAHGGNIYSSTIGGKYDSMSGTSMATPNTCGIVVVIRDYVKETWPDLTPKQVTERVNQLLMSTADICLNEVGNPYSPRKQGAGLASLLNAVTTNAYLSVDGQAKTKLELKDDPNRTGVYDCTFRVNNVSNKEVTYDVSNLTMTETVSDNDGIVTVAETAYMLNPSQVVSVDSNLSYSNGTLTVPANTNGLVTVKLTLSASDRKYLEDTFVNGMYVEGYITLKANDDNVDLNVPYLAFYGNWLDAPMFDVTYYDVSKDEADNSISEKDKTKAAMYATTAYGKYGEYYMIPLGAYIYDYDAGYDKIAASIDKASISMDEESAIYGFYALYAGLMRGSKELTITISNADTGEVYLERTTYNNLKALYNGGSTLPYYDMYDFFMLDEEKGTVFANNTKFDVKVTAVLDYENGENVNNNTFEMSFWCDYEAPSVDSVEYITEYDKTTKKNRYYLQLTVSDNRYVQAIRPCAIIDNKIVSLTTNPIPVYQNEANQTTVVKFEITDYFDDLANSDYPDTIFYIINDYAMNTNVYYTALGGTDYKDLAFNSDTIEVTAGEQINLNDYVNFENAMLQGLTWTTSNDSVVAVDSGICYGLKKGIATITGTSVSYGTSIQVRVKVKASDNVKTNVTKIVYSGYETQFSFDDDYAYSKIGEVNEFSYMPSSNSFELYPSESIKLYYDIEPWYYNKDNISVVYSSSNEDYVTVSEDGIVTAMKETVGAINIKATVYENGKETIYSTSTSISVNSPFITQGVSLMYYKGWGGEVIIPDDLGIQYIYDYAFSHYMYNGIDKDGYAIYRALGDPYKKEGKECNLYATPITKIVLPTGVHYINKYAFYGLSYLEEVSFAKSYTDKGTVYGIDIYVSAFENCTSLTTINLNDAAKIENYAFKNTALTNVNKDGEENGKDLSNVITIGKEAFKNTNLTKINLESCRYTLDGAFENTNSLTEVSMHEDTPLAKNMFKNSGVTSLNLSASIIPVGFASDATNLENVTFTNNNLIIKKEAFANTNIKTLSFNSSTVNLADLAFDGANIEKLVLGENTLLTLAGSPFANTTKFNTIEATNNSNYQVTNNMLLSVDGKTILLVASAIDVVIPNTVETIANSAFNGNLSETIVIPSTVKNVLAHAFQDSKVKTLTISNETNFDDYAFYNCTLLETVNGLDTLDNISNYMFTNSNISSITIKANATIGYGAFKGNTNLSSVTLNDNVTVGDYAFYKSFKETNNVTLSSAILGEYSFANSNIKNVDASNVVEVKDGAFAENEKLENISLASATVLGKYIFKDNINLSSVVLVDNAIIPDGMFSGATNLSSLTANNILEVGAYAFNENTTLANIDLSHATKIGAYAFYNADSLEIVNLSSVIELKEYAFAEATNITTVTLNDSLTKLADYAFYSENGESLLASINLNNIEEVGYACFYGNTSLVEVNLSKATKINGYAFFSSGINSLLLDNATFVGEYAFCSAPIRTLSIPKLIVAEEGAFAETYEEVIELPECLEVINYAAFGSIYYLKDFKVNGELNYTKYDDNNKPVWQVIDGVLYSYTKTGLLVLSAYPSANSREEYTVASGTYRIDAYAFYTTRYSTTLKEIFFPTSLERIGDCAFGGQETLTTYHFLSYNAPILEGSYNGNLINYMYSLTDNQLTDMADELYKIKTTQIYNMYYYYYPYYYCNFYDYVGFAEGLTMYYPRNGKGYDNKIYNAYFEEKCFEKTVADDVTTRALNALDLIKDIDIVTKENADLIMDAYDKYKLITNEEQKTLISNEQVSQLNSLYNKVLDLNNPQLSLEEVKTLASEYNGTDSDGNKYQFVINEDGTGSIKFDNATNTKLNKELTFELIRHNDTGYQVVANNDVTFTFSKNEDGSILFKYYVTKVTLQDKNKVVEKETEEPTTKKGCKSATIPSMFGLIAIASLLLNNKKRKEVR